MDVSTIDHMAGWLNEKLGLFDCKAKCGEILVYARALYTTTNPKINTLALC